MPTPRRYANQAEKQAAYRQRRSEARSPSPVLDLPARAGPARWADLIRQAVRLLGVVQEEMEACFEQRSEAWQASDRGEAFQERLEAVQEAQAAVEDLIGQR